MKVEVDVLGSPSLTVCTVTVDINQHRMSVDTVIVQECVRVEVDILGCPS